MIDGNKDGNIEKKKIQSYKALLFVPDVVVVVVIDDDDETRAAVRRKKITVICILKTNYTNIGLVPQGKLGWSVYRERLLLS